MKYKTLIIFFTPLRRIRFSFYVFCFCLISCNSSKKENRHVTTRYGDTNFVKEEHFFENSQDTSSYKCIMYYMNGAKESEGMVAHSKRDGEWKEWYADGILRRTVKYINGEIDVFNKKRQIPGLQFSADSLIAGKQALIKFINSYPSDGLGCDNGIIWSLDDKSYYDFAVIPSNKDSIHFTYACFWCQPEQSDTIILPASDTKKLAKFGLTEKDAEGQSSITVISNNAKSIVLRTLPVYKK